MRVGLIVSKFLTVAVAIIVTGCGTKVPTQQSAAICGEVGISGTWEAEVNYYAVITPEEKAVEESFKRAGDEFPKFRVYEQSFCRQEHIETDGHGITDEWVEIVETAESWEMT